MKDGDKRRPVKYCLLLAVALLSVAAVVRAQTKKDRLDLDPLDATSARELMLPSAAQPYSVPLESTIDPERYTVGPSDVMSVSVWISPPVTFTLSVTPEGTLIVPTVGEIKVAHITLAAAKAEVIAQTRKKYLAAPLTVTLIKPRPIIVNVVGRVLNPGLYNLTAADRANRAIEEANMPTRLQRQEDLAVARYLMSSRHLLLKHRDGTSERVDLQKYLATKEDKLNPYLREGDVVVVPQRDSRRNVFGVYGDVNVPGRYEWVQGDSLTDAIKIAQGTTSRAILNQVEFSRLDENGDSMTTRLVDLEAIQNGSQPNILLESGDRVVVPGRQDEREDYRASVVGEVRFPGTYPVTKNRTKLSDLIKRAGGFTEFAAIQSAELNRRSVSVEDIDMERLLSLRAGVSSEDSVYYRAETELRLRKEIVNVDFGRLFIQQDTSQDVFLQSEDFVVVPSVKKTVYVFGQVVSPGHIPYIVGEPVEFYVGKAGGATDRARLSDMRVVKAKTKQWLAPKETQVEEGDYVWVPKEPERPFSYYMNIVGQTASVLSVAVSIVLLVIQTNK